jgi:ADP-heptose:LPS heptosyltransferase
MNMKQLATQTLKYPLSHLVNSLLGYFNIFVIFRAGDSIGDQLCMSAIVRLVDMQYKHRIIVISTYPELFLNNPRIWKNYKLIQNKSGNFIVRALRFLSGKWLVNFLYTNNNLIYEEFMRIDAKKLHLVEAHSAHFKININFNEIKNEIYFSEDETKALISKFNLPSHYAVIQPNGKITYTPNKNWGFKNYQAVVLSLGQENWIQVGAYSDKVLNNATNYSGKTSLRELAFLIKYADFVLADEGLLNHIASAFNTKSYVVYSGFSPTEIANYDRTISIVNKPQVECSPCWIRGKCPQKIKYCTENISVNQVVNKIKKDNYDS